MHKSVSSNPSSDFTIHSGPSNIHTPLGHGTSTDHYIQPIPPTYVTEYEEAYQWPKGKHVI